MVVGRDPITRHMGPVPLRTVRRVVGVGTQIYEKPYTRPIGPNFRKNFIWLSIWDSWAQGAGAKRSWARGEGPRRLPAVRPRSPVKTPYKSFISRGLRRALRSPFANHSPRSKSCIVYRLRRAQRAGRRNVVQRVCYQAHTANAP
jgi:hypothetical protein